MKPILTLLLAISLNLIVLAQESFPYTISLDAIVINNMPGIHSFAHAQHENKWLIVGGRLDGLHARQPFNAFPLSQNNTNIYVIDPQSKQVWSRSLNELPTGIKEQLQSTNMNFHQVGDTLYIAGGYAYSATANNHITFPNLTTIQVSSTIKAIQQNTPLNGLFKQITNQQFAVTGGHLVSIHDTFLLVGGHRFDGRYNPMGNPTYTQSYTNQVRRFIIQHHNSEINIEQLPSITNEIHLHRRDYNLIPLLTPNYELAYTISSGVFQPTANLPYLYPVDVNGSSIKAITNFNQYLSNYHSAVANFYVQHLNTQYSLFFGGMSQYYYQNDSLIQDNNVPFTKTISAIKRSHDTDLLELKLPIQMPAYLGAGAEFIVNEKLPLIYHEFADLDAIAEDTLILGYIVGGIAANSLNPFTNNQTNTTSASATIYEVKLIKQKTNTSVEGLMNNVVLESNVFPNPVRDIVHASIKLPEKGDIYITWLDVSGKTIKQETFFNLGKGNQQLSLTIPEQNSHSQLLLIIQLNHKYYSQHWIVKE